MDLVIKNARLVTAPDAPPVDIGVTSGRITTIRPNLTADAKSYDAGSRLVCAGLVETHIHLDKSRIIDRCAPQERSQLSPVKGVTPLKRSMTVEDVRARAARTLEECIKQGTTRMRTQVEVDPGIGMRGFEGVQSLIADYKWAIDIEICVFPQEGLISYPGTDELLVEGLKRRLAGSLRGRKVAVLGLAFKADTDDVRDSLSHKLIRLLERELADVAVHDPMADTPTQPFRDAIAGADAVVLATNHTVFCSEEVLRAVVESTSDDAVLVDPWGGWEIGRVFTPAAEVRAPAAIA